MPLHRASSSSDAPVTPARLPEAGCALASCRRSGRDAAGGGGDGRQRLLAPTRGLAGRALPGQAPCLVHHAVRSWSPRTKGVPKNRAFAFARAVIASLALPGGALRANAAVPVHALHTSAALLQSGSARLRYLPTRVVHSTYNKAGDTYSSTRTSEAANVTPHDCNCKFAVRGFSSHRGSSCPTTPAAS